MSFCQLSSIRAMYSYPEAFEVNIDGLTQIMVERPAAYTPSFMEFYCTEHDCTFKQWRAVLNHLDGGKRMSE